MDNNPVGFTNLYDPLATAGYVYDPSTNTYVPADTSGGVGAVGSTGNQGINPPSPPTTIGSPSTIGPPPPGDNLSFGQPTDPGNLIQSIQDQIPGASMIVNLLKAVGSLPIAIENLINVVEAEHPWTVITSLMAHYADGLARLIPTDQNVWTFIKEYTGGGLLEAMLQDGLGVDVSQFNDDALSGVHTTDQMLKFVFMLQYGIAAVEHVGKGIFANRWPDALSETIAKIPEEMGLSWALGLTIDEAFKTAVGRSIEEGINKQKRGNRIEWPQIRIALKQHILEQFMLDSTGGIVPNPSGANEAQGQAVYQELLKNQGFPDWTIDVLDKLADAQLPVGDLQQMYLRGIMTGAEVKSYMVQLGFNAEDTTRLYEMYIAKAETESSATLRSTARALFTNNLIDETRYRQILTEVSYPAMLIADDIEAINLLHETGRIQTSLTSIKSEYLHKTITPSVAVQMLKTLNYTDEAIHNLFTTWELGPIHAQHGLSQAKILSYMISGLIQPSDAFTKLIALNVDPDTATFLVAHPSSANGVRQHSLTTGMIAQAYAEGAIPQGELAGLYTKIGVTAEALDYYVQQAIWKRSHYKQAPGHVNVLTDADARAAFKTGLMDQSTAMSHLEHNGWSSDDALLLLEITNKGPITPPSAGPFATLADAISFLTGLGYTIQQPPDPLILAAENMIAQSGYSYIMPVGGPPLP